MKEYQNEGKDGFETPVLAMQGHTSSIDSEKGDSFYSVQEVIIEEMAIDGICGVY